MSDLTTSATPTPRESLGDILAKLNVIVERIKKLPPLPASAYMHPEDVRALLRFCHDCGQERGVTGDDLKSGQSRLFGLWIVSDPDQLPGLAEIRDHNGRYIRTVAVRKLKDDDLTAAEKRRTEDG